MGSGKQNVTVDEQEERLGHVFSQREEIIIVGLKILRKDVPLRGEWGTKYSS